MISVRSSSAAQGMRLKRFALGFATYLIMLLVAWLTVFSQPSRVSLELAPLLTVVVLFCQFGFLLFFLTGTNLRFRDPGMTLPQILLGLIWNTLFIACLTEERGTFLMGYVVVLLFAITRLPPQAFAGCAVFAYLSFATLNLIEYQFSPELLGSVSSLLLQFLVLAIGLIWMSLFSSYVQVMRKRMYKRSVALQAHQETLRGMMHQLEELVATDELTGLFNRRHFMRLANKSLSRLRPERTHGLALIDLDHFKRVNDEYGHACGDRVLQVFAEVASSCLREGDVLARYGGEEFVLLIPDADGNQFRQCCERLRLAYAGTMIAELGGERVSLSIGMTLLHMHDELDAALHRADQALYRAKRQGRNCSQSSWDENDGETVCGDEDGRSLVR